MAKSKTVGKGKTKRGRPKVGPINLLLNLRYIRASAAYNEARKKGKGYDDAIEAGARAGDCSLRTLKTWLWHFQPTRTEYKRLRKQQGATAAEIAAELSQMDAKGGLYAVTWERTHDGFALSYAPASSPARKRHHRI